MPLYEPVTTLWIGGRLSRLEQLCLRSFLHHGHPVHLYHYHTIPNVPAGVQTRDAREVLSERDIFRYDRDAHSAYETMPGGYGAFANRWRYHYLVDHGGWWVDADVVCLKPLDVTAMFAWAPESEEWINNAVLRMPARWPLPAMLAEAADVAGRNVEYAGTGPKLLTDMVEQFKLQHYTLPREAFYPHGWREWRVPFEPDGALPASSFTMHLWNEMMRREVFDKDADFPETSQIEQVRAIVK